MDHMATGTRIAVWRLPCKSWSCPKCARKKARQVADRAYYNFKSEHMRFLTLTIVPRSSLTEALSHINAAWNRLRTNITRNYGKIKYFKVLESQPRSKMPHFHVLINKYIPSSWLKMAVVRAGFGRIYKIEDVRSDQILGYVTKYLRKGIDDDVFVHHLLSINGRRFSFSRRLPPPPKPPGYKAVSVIETRDTSMIDVALYWFYLDVSLSGNIYPLSSSANFYSFFSPGPLPLLPAPAGRSSFPG